MRRHGGIATLSALVTRVYPARSRDELLAVRAFGAFMRALSQRVLRNARPVKLMGATLIVHTSNSAWANSLQLESTALLEKIKRSAPDTRIRKLVFRAGPMPEAALPLPHTPLVARGGIPLRDLPDDIARGLARIHHDELREAVKKAVSVGLAAARDERATARHDD
jgi:hypothetical protein